MPGVLQPKPLKLGHLEPQAPKHVLRPIVTENLKRLIRGALGGALVTVLLFERFVYRCYDPGQIHHP